MILRKYIVDGDLVIFDPFGNISFGSSVTDQFGSIYIIGHNRKCIPNIGWGVVVQNVADMTKSKKG